MVTDSELRDLLRKTRLVDAKAICMLRIISSVEVEVSLDTLGKTLERIRSLADANVSTVIYVSLRELPAKKPK